jgi:hypothetical protein
MAITAAGISPSSTLSRIFIRPNGSSLNRSLGIKHQNTAGQSVRKSSVAMNSAKMARLPLGGWRA